MLQIDLLLSCSHIVTVPLESILQTPPIGSLIRCAICEEQHTVSKVGTPYHVTRTVLENVSIKHDKKQKSLLGDDNES